jgi:hypothetical protein
VEKDWRIIRRLQGYGEMFGMRNYFNKYWLLQNGNGRDKERSSSFPSHHLLKPHKERKDEVKSLLIDTKENHKTLNSH